MEIISSILNAEENRCIVTLYDIHDIKLENSNISLTALSANIEAKEIKITSIKIGGEKYSLEKYRISNLEIIFLRDYNPPMDVFGVIDVNIFTKRKSLAINISFDTNRASKSFFDLLKNNNSLKDVYFLENNFTLNN